MPLGIISIISIIYFISNVILNSIQDPKRMLKQVQHDTSLMILLLILFWILLLFFYQGFQFVKALRYFYPIYPFLAILSSYFISKILIKFKSKLLCYCITVLLALLTIIYPLSFVSIYYRPHPRITASEWIYQNIPAGSTLSAEHWDDGLPLSLPEEGYIHEKYKTVEFPL